MCVFFGMQTVTHMCSCRDDRCLNTFFRKGLWKCTVYTVTVMAIWRLASLFSMPRRDRKWTKTQNKNRVMFWYVAPFFNGLELAAGKWWADLFKPSTFLMGSFFKNSRQLKQQNNNKNKAFRNAESMNWYLKCANILHRNCARIWVWNFVATAFIYIKKKNESVGIIMHIRNFKKIPWIFFDCNLIFPHWNILRMKIYDTIRILLKP